MSEVSRTSGALKVAGADQLWRTGLRMKELSRGLQGGSAHAIRRAADDIGKEMLRIVRQEVTQSARAPTGRLAKSFTVARTSVGKTRVVDVRVTSPRRYARIVDTGGRIRSSRKLMTVPLRAPAKRRRARFHPNTFRLRGGIPTRDTPRDGDIIVQRQGRTVRPLYVLKREVKIKGNRYLQKAQRRIRKYAVERMGVGIRDLSKGIFRG